MIKASNIPNYIIEGINLFNSKMTEKMSTEIVDDEEDNRHDSLMEQGIHLYYHYYHHLE
jgi:hypothetical protein